MPSSAKSSRTGGKADPTPVYTLDYNLRTRLMKLEELKELLEALNHHRVTSFEHEGLKLTLNPSGPKPDKTDETPSNPDDLLFWSAQ